MGQGITSPYQAKTATISLMESGHYDYRGYSAGFSGECIGRCRGEFRLHSSGGGRKDQGGHRRYGVAPAEHTITANFTPGGAKGYHPATATAPLTVNAKDSTNLASN